MAATTPTLKTDFSGFSISLPDTGTAIASRAVIINVPNMMIHAITLIILDMFTVAVLLAPATLTEFLLNIASSFCNPA